MAGPWKKCTKSEGYVTVQDVAQEAGVSTATVSRVSSGQGNVTESTRQKVEAAIARLNYRPDLTAASLRQRSRQRTQSLVNVAVLTKFHRYQPNKTPAIRATIEAGKVRGFHVEHFDLTHHGPADRLLKKLYNRGFEAVIFEALSYKDELLRVEDLVPFALVSYDRRVQSFPCHIVRYDIAEVLERTWDLLTARGYQRIGLIKHSFEHEHPDERVMKEIAEGLLTSTPKKRRVPIYDDRVLRPKAKERAFQDWLEKHQPDVVVGYGAWQIDWLERCGLKAPEDIAYVSMQDSEPPVSGWRASMHVMADHALDLIEQMLRRGIRGPQPNYLETVIRPEWVQGETLPEGRRNP